MVGKAPFPCKVFFIPEIKELQVSGVKSSHSYKDRAQTEEL